MADKLITDIPLITRYSRHNENTDLKFRNYIKLSNLSNAELDSAVQEITERVWSQIDCLSCGNCCKTLEIEVDDQDSTRLAKFLSISKGQFQEKYTRLAEDSTRVIKSVPCIFLEADNRCRVYAARPQACRDFPYLHKGFRSRTFMMLSNLSVCPIVFNVWQQLKDTLWGGDSRASRGHRPRRNRP